MVNSENECLAISFYHELFKKEKATAAEANAKNLSLTADIGELRGFLNFLFLSFLDFFLIFF